MKKVELYVPSDPAYAEICDFARTIYQRELSLTLKRFPRALFAITSEDEIIGCIGINEQLGSLLFRNDVRLMKVIEAECPGTVFGEQSVLAILQYSIGLPILISVAAAYGNKCGVHRIAYAAIPVSMKTIDALGFSPTPYGSISLDVLPESERENYAGWHRHGPVGYVLNTEHALSICTTVLKRFARKVELGQRLSHILYGEDVRLAA